MEALQNAFEVLHCKADVVQRTFRERRTGPSIANQSRRGSFVEARLGRMFIRVAVQTNRA